MKHSDSKKILELLTQLSEAVIGTATSRTRTAPPASLSERVDALNTRVITLDEKVGTSRSDKPLAAQVDAVVEDLDILKRRVGTSRRNLPLAVHLDALDTKVEKRFDAVDRSIESARVEIVDLVTRVHSELTGRVIDLEIPQPGGKGSGGRGSGGSGVPLAS